MPLDPNSTLHVQRLQHAMKWSRMRLKTYRQARLAAIAQYVGKSYGGRGAGDRVSINFVELAINIFIQHLAARNPKVLVVTPHLNLKAPASTFELGVNHLLKEIRFNRSLRQVVRDALFSIGIVKVGIELTNVTEVQGFYHDAGQPFADTVSLDDWVHDMTAHKYEEIQYAGNRYRVPLETVKANELFDPEVRNLLQPTPQTAINEDGETRAEAIGRGEDHGEPEEIRDFIDLWDVWVPLEGLMITFATAQREGQFTLIDRPLRVVEWDGPEGGPYRVLSFNEVPDTIMPLAPSSQWMGLHLLANQLFNKIGRQASAQKRNHGFRGDAAADMQRLRDAADGDSILMNNPEGIKEFATGGFDPATLAFVQQIRDLFTYFAGNLDALGGLQPQSPTLGQDQMLLSSSSMRAEDMQDRVNEFTRDIVRDLGWYLWTDELIELPLVKRLPGTDLRIPVTFSADQREGDFLDYNLEIEPYSMQPQSPQARLQTLTGVFQNFVAPFLPMMQAQGINIDFEGLLKLIAKYTDFKEMSEVLTLGDLVPQQQGQQQGPAQAPVTRRVNERISRPSGTAQTRQTNVMEQLLSGRNGTPQGTPPAA